MNNARLRIIDKQLKAMYESQGKGASLVTYKEAIISWSRWAYIAEQQSKAQIESQSSVKFKFTNKVGHMLKTDTYC